MRRHPSLQSLPHNATPKTLWSDPEITALRWAITGDTDGWFWSHFHRIGPCVCGCGRLADTYPGGLGQAPAEPQLSIAMQSASTHLLTFMRIRIVAERELPAGATVLVADEGDARYALLHQRDMQYDHYHCKCGSVHIAVKTTRPVAQGDLLLFDEGHADPLHTLLVQFDGSYKPQTKKGGAGVAALIARQNGVHLLEWQAIIIANCPDNIFAETAACHHATLLAAKWYAILSAQNALRVTIQGTSCPSSNTSTIVRASVTLAYSNDS